MPTRDRKLWNSAERIVAALQRSRVRPGQARLPLQHQTELLRLHRQHETARQRGWLAAARQVQESLRVRSQWFVNDLQQFVAAMRPEPNEPIATVGDLYRDVLALRPEFPFVHVDRPETTVSVVTDRIVLEEIDLGPFEIVWNWSHLGEDRELRVIPQEPVRAAADHEVCHPHLRRHSLCLGEAETSLRWAFRAGRLFDAFLIVRQVLQTYNPSSPHVALSDWFSGHCPSCDQSLNDSDSWVCETCSDTVCDDCHASCHICGHTLCPQCETTCSDCDKSVCRACRPMRGNRRSDCCLTCHKKEQSDDDASATDDEDEIPSPPHSGDPGPAILPDRVGETRVPAGCG